MSPFSHLHEEVQSSGHLELDEDFLDIGLFMQFIPLL